MVTEVPKRFHNTPEVIESKQREYNNFLKFNAFEEIEDVGQSRIGSRWVVTEKETHDGMKTKTKSRLVVRGFQEEEQPRSDSPTLAKESMKTMISIAANEGWKVRALDVTNAYLQAKPVDRDIFVEPPKDLKKPGVIWKLLKSVYGTFDGSRNFYLSVDEEIRQLGGKLITGEEAL